MNDNGVKQKREKKIIILFFFHFPPPSQIISKVSLKSRKNGIYVLINVIERVKSTTVTKNKYNLYSTNIVFDRNGCIVSR